MSCSQLPLLMPGMCSRTTWSRPRPGVFEAKATKFCTRGWGHTSRTPYLGFFYRATLLRERLCQVVCLSITLKFNALLTPLVRLCMNYEVLYLWYWVLYLPYSKIQRLRPDLEAKVKAVHRRGQGQRSSRPRPQNFVLELSSRSRPVLEDPIPV